MAGFPVVVFGECNRSRVLPVSVGIPMFAILRLRGTERRTAGAPMIREFIFVRAAIVRSHALRSHTSSHPR